MNPRYAEYLASDEWKAKRKLRLEMDGNKCRACNAIHKLAVHHLTYERIFREDLLDLITLCEYHHAAIEEQIQRGMVKRTGDVILLAADTIRIVRQYGKKVVLDLRPTDRSHHCEEIMTKQFIRAQPWFEEYLKLPWTECRKRVKIMFRKHPQRRQIQGRVFGMMSAERHRFVNCLFSAALSPRRFPCAVS